MTAASVVGVVRRCSVELGVDLPPGFLTALDKAAGLIAAADALSVGPQALHSAVIDCLKRGGDIHADKKVARAALDQQLSVAGVGQAARDAAERDIASMTIEYTDEMLSSWSDTLQPYLDKLSAAGVVLQHVEDLDSDYSHVVARGENALRAHADAVEALRLTKAATDATALLAMGSGVSLTRERRILMLASADIDTLDRIVHDTGRQIDAWAAARFGLSLCLVTSVAELVERIADIDSQRQAVIDAEAERQRHPRRPAFQSFG